MRASEPCGFTRPSLHAAMKHLSAEAKHHILLEYSAADATRSFAALAARHHIKGGREAVRQWHLRWNGTAASLQRKQGTGRARALSAAQVRRHIAAPIRNSNRAARAVRYTKLLPQVQAATGSQLSLRTLQRYGKEEADGRSTRGKKRTADESEHTHTCAMRKCCSCVECAHSASPPVIALTFSVHRHVRTDRTSEKEVAAHQQTTRSLP